MDDSPALRERIREIAYQLVRQLDAAASAGEADPHEVQSKVFQALQSSLDRLADTHCHGPANQLPSSEFWNITRSWLEQGSLQLHARQKPLGYAGDYQLLDRICREDVQGRGLGLAMDLFFQQQSAPQAVRNRCRSIAGVIHDLVVERNDQRIKIASIGSGPAWDLRWALQELGDHRRQVLAHLLDIDPGALAFCAQGLRGLIPEDQLQTRRVNLKRLPRLQQELAALAGAQLIYCAGFFDYLDDAQAIQMLQTLWSCLAPDGELLVFNFSDHNPSRAYMEWIGNWYLIERTADSLRGLAEQCNFSSDGLEIGVEPAGVNLYLRIRKK